MPAEEVARIVTPLIVSAGIADEATLTSMEDRYLATLDLLKVRARTTDEIVKQIRPYLPGSVDYDPEAIAKGWKDRAGSREMIAAARDFLSRLKTWDQGGLEDCLKLLAEAKGVSAGKLYQPMRVALTGLTVSPGIFEILAAMGREQSLRRLSDAETWLTEHGT
jgi:glutamyl-tRNA synthetase